jgi:putative hydroxymethylpyrimidine transport system ATP-binding protein
MVTPVFQTINVSHSFRSNNGRSGGVTLPVLVNVSITLQPGEIVALLGPSGSGKSTLLNIIAGLLQPDAGVVEVYGERRANRLGCFGYMPQKDLLLPWRNALDNAALGLEVAGMPRSQAREAAMAMLETFGLVQFARAQPRQLSGGMRQRIALIRTFLLGKDVLLDEPFGALDAITRGELQEWLLQVQALTARAVFLITHDLDEALFLADRVYLLSPRPGRIRAEIRVDLPRPRTLEVTTTPHFAALKADLLARLRSALQPNEVGAS